MSQKAPEFERLWEDGSGTWIRKGRVVLAYRKSRGAEVVRSCNIFFSFLSQRLERRSKTYGQSGKEDMAFIKFANWGLEVERFGGRVLGLGI